MEIFDSALLAWQGLTFSLSAQGQPCSALRFFDVTHSETDGLGEILTCSTDHSHAN